MTMFSLGRGPRALFLALSLSVFSFSVFAQASSSSAQTESRPVTEDAPSAGGSSENWSWSDGDYGQPQGAPSAFSLFLRMVLALAAVLVMAYIAMRLLRKGTRLTNSDDPFLRHVSHLSLSTGRSVDVVTVLDHAYILGVSDNAVNLVGEIADKELVNSMNLYADKNDNTRRPRSFEDILNIFMPNSGRTQGENVYGSSAWNASEMLRRQRERLNDAGGEEGHE